MVLLKFYPLTTLGLCFDMIQEMKRIEIIYLMKFVLIIHDTDLFILPPSGHYGLLIYPFASRSWMIYVEIICNDLNTTVIC